MVSQGQALFCVDGVATPLLYGTTPAWRTLSDGVTGPDVAELNADLVALGDATAAELNPTSDEFGAATVSAVKALQASLGDPQTGALTLGHVIFLSTPLRVTVVVPTVGSAADGGQLVSGTSTTRHVTFDLPATERTEVRLGDAATITLPDQHQTPGVVASIGADASSGTPSTVVVDVTPADPAATGTADQEKVGLAVTTGSVASALAIPVAALTSTSDGHPAIEVMGSRGAQLVPVTVGLFDDANGLLQISAPGLSAGDQVVIPGG